MEGRKETNSSFNASRSILEGNSSFDAKEEAVITLCHVANVIMLCAVLWILLCWIHYAKRGNKWRTTDGGKLFITCFTAIALNVPRLVLMVMEYHVGDIPGAWKHCEALVDATNGAYAFPVFSTYLFLWMRQRTIYQHPMMQAKHHGKIVNVISWIFLVMISMCFSAVLVGYVFPLSYTFSAEKGCIFLPSDGKSPGSGNLFNTLRYSMLGMMVFTELVLLSLFVYPMIRIKRFRNEDVQGDNLSRMIRRSTICSAIAIFSDTLISVLVLIIQGKESVIFGQTMYNISLFVNDLCIASTFEAFAKILTVFCSSCNYFKKASKQIGDVQGTTSQSQTEYLN